MGFNSSLPQLVWDFKALLLLYAMKLFETSLHEFLESQNTGWSITSLSVTASKIFDIPSVCL